MEKQNGNGVIGSEMGHGRREEGRRGGTRRSRRWDRDFRDLLVGHGNSRSLWRRLGGIMPRILEPYCLLCVEYSKSCHQQI